jgi:uncharacterized protein (DUF305 family)
MNRTAPVTVALALIMATVLAGCGISTTEQSPDPAQPSSAQPGSAEPAAQHNDADVAFVQQMIPHHQQAVAMAKLASSRAAAPAVKELAGRIESAQQPEIDQMTGMLTSWKVPASASPEGPSMPGMSGDHDMGNHDMSNHDMSGHQMTGMMSAQQMTQLEGATGASFDKQFLSMMIDHHQGAVRMATTELRDGSSTSAKSLARAISDAQTAEINQMHTMLAAG